MPQTKPSTIKLGICVQENTNRIWGMLKIASPGSCIRLKIACVVTLATTDAIITGVTARIEKSKRITSSVKSNPPIGELNIALIPAAVPHPMISGICALAIRKNWPIPEAMPAPICKIGPSAPPEPPEPSVTALVMIFSIAADGFMKPDERMTLSSTSITPRPWRSRTMTLAMMPVTSPPSAGQMMRSGMPVR